MGQRESSPGFIATERACFRPKFSSHPAATYSSNVHLSSILLIERFKTWRPNSLLAINDLALSRPVHLIYLFLCLLLFFVGDSMYRV